MSKPQPAAWRLLAGLSLGLAGCGGGGDASKDASGDGTGPMRASLTGAGAGAPAFKLADGPDICFRKIAERLGADAKVSEINSFFSSGGEVDSTDREPEGVLTVCSVQYQNPDDPRKLLNTSMDVRSGEFSPPGPVEITVMGGDAAAFKLEDHIIPLAQVNTAGVKRIMDAQKARLDGVYGRYAWSGLRLMAPGAFDDVHRLRLDVEGRLKSNDVKESGYAELPVDGSRIVEDHLTP